LNQKVLERKWGDMKTHWKRIYEKAEEKEVAGRSKRERKK
jgi:hypothetical protein